MNVCYKFCKDGSDSLSDILLTIIIDSQTHRCHWAHYQLPVYDTPWQRRN